MAYGKEIELFLVNGTADSLITAELSNWNGKAIKIPRTEVAACDRDDIKGVRRSKFPGRKLLLVTVMISKALEFIF